MKRFPNDDNASSPKIVGKEKKNGPFFLHDKSRGVPRPWEFSSDIVVMCSSKSVFGLRGTCLKLPNSGVVLRKKSGVHLYRSLIL